MTASSTIEAKLRGRGSSSTPGQAAAKVLGVEPVDEEAEARFSNLVHWGYGTVWGGVRVLQNLISNALRYTPAGGMIFLRAEPQGEVVRVEVLDTGEGISPEDLPRVFERSFRGEMPRMRPEEDSVPGGAGLGLAIAQGIVEAHRSRIEVESRPGEGTRFYFTLRRRA